jgi:type I restriction enzyme, S subunit
MKPTEAIPHPADWETTTVAKDIEIKRGISWSKEQEYGEPGQGRVPVVRIGNVQDKLILDDRLYLAGLTPAAIEKKRATDGWSIIVGSNGNRKRVGNAVFVKNGLNLLFASFLIAACPKTGSNLTPNYFFRWLTSEQIQAHLSASSEGTTGLNNLSHSFFRSMAIPFPSRREQEAIACVFNAADSVVEKAQESMKQVSLLRKALLQSFFHFERCNEPLVKTDFGRIPKTWEWVKGKKAFVIIGGGTSESSIKYSDNHVEPDAWFMKVDDFNNPANRRSIVQTKVGFQTAANPKIKLIPKDTLIIAKRGAAILKNRVRISAVPLVLDPNLMGIQMYDGIMPEFFAYQLEWRNLSRFLEDSGIPQLNNKDLYPRYFLKAPPGEQKKIVSAIKTAEDYEDALWVQLDGYEKLKRALMHDLLTGKVRVNHAIDQILSLEAS